jgi:hypothetical protein
MLSLAKGMAGETEPCESHLSHDLTPKVMVSALGRLGRLLRPRLPGSVGKQPSRDPEDLLKKRVRQLIFWCMVVLSRPPFVCDILQSCEVLGPRMVHGFQQRSSVPCDFLQKILTPNRSGHRERTRQPDRDRQHRVLTASASIRPTSLL